MVALLASVLLVAFFELVTLQRALYFFDISEQIGPLRYAFSQALGEGRLPLWSDGMFSGFPIFAEGQGGPLYPLNLIFYPFLPFWQALNLTYTLLELVAALSAYALFRQHASRGAAAVGALVYALSGALLTHHFHIPILSAMALAPAALALLELLLRRPSPARFAALAGVWAVVHFAGHSQSATLLALASLVYTLCRYQRELGWRGSLGQLGLLGAAVVTGAALAAVQLLPTFELAQLSMRSEPLSAAARTVSSYPPWLVGSLFFPHIFGSRALDTVSGVGPGLLHEMFNFVGVCVPVVVAFAWRSPRRLARRLFAGLALSALVMALGKHALVFEWLTALPGLSHFRIPARFNLIVALGLAGLVAVGLDALAEGLRNGKARAPWWWGLPAIGALASFAISAALYLSREQIRRRLFGDVEAALFRAEVGDDLLLRGSLLAIAVAAIAVGLWRRRPVAILVVGAVMVIDLVTFARGALPTAPPSYWDAAPGTVEILRRVPPARLAATGCRPAYRPWGWDRPARRDAHRHALGQLNFTIPLLFDLDSVLGHTPLRLRSTIRFLRRRSAREMGAHYWVTCGEAPADHRLLGESHGVRVYVVPDPIPRAYMADVSPGGARPSVQLLPRPAETPSACRGDDRVEITHADDEAVEIAVEAACAGFLVLRDTHYPGWRAFVDDNETPILEADRVFRAVPVSAGHHRVRFTFVSGSFRAGLAISGVTLTLLLAALGVALHRERRRPGSTEAR